MASALVVASVCGWRLGPAPHAASPQTAMSPSERRANWRTVRGLARVRRRGATGKGYCITQVVRAALSMISAVKPFGSYERERAKSRREAGLAGRNLESADHRAAGRARRAHRSQGTTFVPPNSD